MNNVDRLANMLGNIINQANKWKTAKSIYRGVINGQNVMVNGRAYRYTLAVDVPIKNGDSVSCIFDENQSKVVVVGK